MNESCPTRCSEGTACERVQSEQCCRILSTTLLQLGLSRKPPWGLQTGAERNKDKNQTLTLQQFSICKTVICYFSVLSTLSSCVHSSSIPLLYSLLLPGFSGDVPLSSGSRLFCHVTVRVPVAANDPCFLFHRLLEFWR